MTNSKKLQEERRISFEFSKKDCIELEKQHRFSTTRGGCCIFQRSLLLRLQKIPRANHKDLWLDINLVNYRGRTGGRIVSHPLPRLSNSNGTIPNLWGQFSRGGLPEINTKNRPTDRKQRPQISARLFKRGGRRLKCWCYR